MVQYVVAGLFTIIVALLSIFGTLYLQSVLSKEKFKELIYREQFSAYKEIAELAFRIWYLCLKLSIDHQEMEKLAGEARRLQEAIDKNRLFLSRGVQEKLKKYTKVITNAGIAAMRVPAKKIEDLILHQGDTKIIETSYNAVIDEMRKDLCIDALTESNRRTFKFGF